MKQSRKLKRSEKELLTKRGFDATIHRFIEEDDIAIRFENTVTGNKDIWIEKG